jgi:hypothetical protein
MLQMLQALCAHHRLTIGSDAEISDLAARTDPQQVIEELRKAVPGVENVERSEFPQPESKETA